MNNVETGCCPKFDKTPWDEKEIQWENKLFINARVKSFMHMPLNFGSVIKRCMKKIEQSSANNPDYLMLSDENSLWGSDLFIAVNKKIDNANNVTISGHFISKVFEGPFQNAGKWAKEMEFYVNTKGKKTKKIYFWYTTCPKCAKVYGKNYVVLFAQV
ncbi:MAG: hypothetical protein HUU48_12400 [Flavobacteriales bacterium]|nr:hypothetical protein [Flavobacteriales bacterium]